MLKDKKICIENISSRRSTFINVLASKYIQLQRNLQMFDLIVPELFHHYKSPKSNELYHQNFMFRIQSTHDPVMEAINSHQFTGRMWQRKPEGLIHAVIFVIAFHF